MTTGGYFLTELLITFYTMTKHFLCKVTAMVLLAAVVYTLSWAFRRNHRTDAKTVDTVKCYEDVDELVSDCKGYAVVVSSKKVRISSDVSANVISVSDSTKTIRTCKNVEFEVKPGTTLIIK